MTVSTHASRMVQQMVTGGTDFEVGPIISWVVLPIEEFKARNIAEYGDLDGFNEDDLNNSTHVLRFAMAADDVELVDGDDWFFHYDEDADTFELVSEPDAPAFHGGTVRDAILWVAQMAPTYYA